MILNQVNMTKKYILRLTADAKTDLIEIRHYTIRQWSLEQSKKYLTELRQTFHLLTQKPGIGKPRPDIGPTILSFPHARHVIYFTVYEQQLVIFAVLHKNRVPSNHLEKREFI